ncbi:S66 peptidase family protein [Pirellulimonas nuda]|nr:LD-carboxypeptidase [Pirellulimonas nuda]
MSALPAAAAPPTKPAALRPGDTIMFVAPAGELVEPRMLRAAERLRERGYKVRVPDDLFRQRGYLAGTDQQRAAELMQALTDPEVDAVFPGTGGYGTMRILNLLDWEKIRAHPKIVIGFSDITALHLALAAKCNWVSFHSPNPQWGLGTKEGWNKFSEDCFWHMLEGGSPQQTSPPYEYAQPESLGPRECLSPGTAEGRLIGGNLTVLAALVGTPYEPVTRGRVLFLEDINEAPYRVDRMLCQLKLAGLLDRPAAVLLGQFKDCDAKDDDSSLSLPQVFQDYFADAPYPVVANFPAGHVALNATLPVGGRFSIDGDSGQVTLLGRPTEEGPASHKP